MKQFKISKNYTNRSEESLDRYLVEISRMPMITPDQEVELAQIIRKGGKKGEDRDGGGSLICAYKGQWFL